MWRFCYALQRKTLQSQNSTLSGQPSIFTHLLFHLPSTPKECKYKLFRISFGLFITFTSFRIVITYPLNFCFHHSGEQCAAQLEVCCLLPLNSLNDTSIPTNPIIPTSSSGGSESPITNSPIRQTTNSSPIITVTESSAGTTADPNGCQCVPFNRCLNTTDPISGAGNIDVR